MNPSDLVTARFVRRIRRANPSIGKEAAREMTAELFDLIECVRARRPGEDDLVQMIMRWIVNDWPQDDAAAEDAAGNDCVELAIALTPGPDDPSDNLFLRYMRLFDRINGTDIVGEFGLDDPPAKKPGPVLVRDDLPPLDLLKQAVIAQIKLDQLLPPDKQVVLPLLPEFKDSAGIRFVMHATEAHRAALFDLTQKAGILIV